MQQISFFDGNKKFKIDKPIRLIELFAGYGSQHLALKYLGINAESYRICEWAVKSIQAYKDAHFNNDDTDYSANHSIEFIINRLVSYGISANYNEPMTKEQIKRMGEQKCRQIYNNIKATHNFVNIQKTHAQDLRIVDTDKYCYVMTYSFPCQDLSSVGLGKGMEKGSGTRSGMLWEVERILDECKELPQVLLMENVPEVIGSNNIKHFAKWLEKLESLGYKCYWKVLNAKDYGIPQNRERCFMVSILGDYYYKFPQKIKLEHKLKDLLEDKVDEKYYLSEKALNGCLNTNFDCYKLDLRLPKDGIVPTICARDYKDPKLVFGVGEKKSNGGTQYYQQNRIYSGDGIAMCHPANLTSGSYMYAFKDKNPKEQLCNQFIRDEKDNNSFVAKKIDKYLKDHKELPEFFNPYNCADCGDIAPTQTTCCGSLTSSSTVLIKGKNKRLKSLVEKINFGEETLALDCYNQVTHENCMQTIKTNVDTSNMNMVYNDLRIRKLTPKECFRLMGVKDEDFERIAENQSNASLYHLAGDSIVVNVLMEIFKEML